MEELTLSLQGTAFHYNLQSHRYFPKKKKNKPRVSIFDIPIPNHTIPPTYHRVAENFVIPQYFANSRTPSFKCAPLVNRSDTTEGAPMKTREKKNKIKLLVFLNVKKLFESVLWRSYHHERPRRHLLMMYGRRCV